jgi:hypothetical protein
LSIQSLFSYLFLSASDIKKAEPKDTYDKHWIDNDVYDNGEKGMKKHARFTAHCMKEMDAYHAI